MTSFQRYNSLPSRFELGTLLCSVMGAALDFVVVQSRCLQWHAHTLGGGTSAFHLHGRPSSALPSCDSTDIQCMRMWLEYILPTCIVHSLSELS